MGPGEKPNYIISIGVSVSALSDHLMGPRKSKGLPAYDFCFSIRSFGSFDGTPALLIAG